MISRNGSEDLGHEDSPKKGNLRPSSWRVQRGLSLATRQSFGNRGSVRGLAWNFSFVYGLPELLPEIAQILIAENPHTRFG